MPPQSNPNWRHLEEYEQIKRKNRRRLVGALLLTTVVALLLAKVAGSDKNTAAPSEITVNSGETAASLAALPDDGPLPEPAAEVPDGADIAVETQPQPVSSPPVVPENTVAEPAPPVPPPAMPDKPVETRTAVLPNPLANAANPPRRQSAPPVREENRAAPQAEAKAKPAPAERRPAVEAGQPGRTLPRVQRAENNQPPATVPQVRPAVPERPRRAESAKPLPPAAQPERRAEAKPAEQRRQDGPKPAERRPAERRQERKPEGGRLSPEDILNNRAANRVAGHDKAAAEPTAQPARRMVIQVGAYTTEEQARAVQKRLADAGVSAYVAPPANKGGNALYRVRTGSYPNRQAVGQAMGKIKSQGLDGILLER